jgi:hypothetical protein
MFARLVDVGLIVDSSALSDLTAQVGAMICNGCRDPGALIAGLLVIDQDEEAWPLCGECLLRLPWAGHIA